MNKSARQREWLGLVLGLVLGTRSWREVRTRQRRSRQRKRMGRQACDHQVGRRAESWQHYCRR